MTKVAWVVQVNGVDVDGPFFLQSAALLRKHDFPGAVVLRRMVEVEPSSIMSRLQYGRGW